MSNDYKFVNPDDLAEYGFTPAQIEILLKADHLVASGAASTLDELQEQIGYGVIDAAVLRDTFFSN